MVLLSLVVKQLITAITTKTFSVLWTCFIILKENPTQFIFLLQILQGSYVKQERFLVSTLIFLHTGCSLGAWRMCLLRSLKEKFSVLITAVASSTTIDIQEISVDSKYLETQHLADFLLNGNFADFFKMLSSLIRVVNNIVWQKW